MEVVDHQVGCCCLVNRSFSHSRQSCGRATVKATVRLVLITANPFNHADLRDLLMIEWE